MEDQVLPSYKAEVIEIHSGDDIILMVSLGLDHLYKKVRARLQGVDTPDAYKAGSETQAGLVRDRVSKLLKGKECTIKVHSQNAGKSGWVITLYIGTDIHSESLNEILRQEGYVFRGNKNAA